MFYRMRLFYKIIFLQSDFFFNRIKFFEGDANIYFKQITFFEKKKKDFVKIMQIFFFKM